MSDQNFAHVLSSTVEQLSDPKSLEGLFHQHRDGSPLPSGKALEEIIELSRAILFPGYYGKSSIDIKTIRYHIGVNLERLHKLLSDQILAGLCFCITCDEDSFETLSTLRKQAEITATKLIAKLPDIRRVLATDVQAAYNGDPAAESSAEIISCYPVIKALTNYRIAHELVVLNVPLIPRMMTEMAHSETGIDIHPAATIGNYFTIDHGSLFEDHFSKPGAGDEVSLMSPTEILKALHSDPGNHSNATILGRITIGSNCVVGANVWVTKDMPAYTRKYNKEPIDNFDQQFNNGTGI